MLLDMQKLFNWVTGGLSGLSKVDKHIIKWLQLTFIHLLFDIFFLGRDMFADSNFIYSEMLSGSIRTWFEQGTTK